MTEQEPMYQDKPWTHYAAMVDAELLMYWQSNRSTKEFAARMRELIQQAASAGFQRGYKAHRDDMRKAGVLKEAKRVPSPERVRTRAREEEEHREDVPGYVYVGNVQDALRFAARSVIQRDDPRLIIVTNKYDVCAFQGRDLTGYQLVLGPEHEWESDMHLYVRGALRARQRQS